MILPIFKIEARAQKLRKFPRKLIQV